MAEKHIFVHDEKFDQMFKELENDPKYLEELKKIEDSERRTMVDKSELRKTLLAMKRRIKKFGDLRSECCWRDHMDGVSEGWLSSTEIYKFEKDMEELVKQALKIERKSCNG